MGSDGPLPGDEGAGRLVSGPVNNALSRGFHPLSAMSLSRPPRLVPGVDFYVEDGKFVFTATYHRKRGYCCNSRCRHCPYGNAAGEPTPVVRILGLDPPDGTRQS